MPMMHPPAVAAIARDRALLDMASGTRTENPFTRHDEERAEYSYAYYIERRDYEQAVAALKGEPA